MRSLILTLGINIFHIHNIDPCSGAGLPDGLLSNQKSKFGYILEGHRMENFGIFCDHFLYFMAIW
jgi:hypothetical protein